MLKPFQVTVRLKTVLTSQSLLLLCVFTQLLCAWPDLCSPRPASIVTFIYSFFHLICEHSIAVTSSPNPFQAPLFLVGKAFFDITHASSPSHCVFVFL